MEDALCEILRAVEPLNAVEQNLLDSLGLTLAEDIQSTINVPPMDCSALDGYALRFEDAKGASDLNPRSLRVVDVTPAGDGSRKRIAPGEAIRIMTGASLPDGADCVVGFEDTDEMQQMLADGKIPSPIRILSARGAGANIRKSGESIKCNEIVLAKGAVLRPSEIGVLASMGIARVNVIRRPVAAILATGNELTPLGEPLRESRIYNSNSYSIAAQIFRDGGIPRILGIARDNEAAVLEKLEQAEDADLLITIGGVSMGDYDVIKKILAKRSDIVLWNVRIKPGKPMAFGTLRRQAAHCSSRDALLFGLAGNPVSCMVNYELFVRPAILKMMGKRNLALPHVNAVMEEGVDNRFGRRTYARVSVQRKHGCYSARLSGPQGSGVLTSMILANGLAIIPEDKTRIQKGEIVQVLMLDWKQDINDIDADERITSTAMNL
jgi:molybdopterin molybdotransferase